MTRSNYPLTLTSRTQPILKKMIILFLVCLSLYEQVSIPFSCWVLDIRNCRPMTTNSSDSMLAKIFQIELKLAKTIYIVKDIINTWRWGYSMAVANLKGLPFVTKLVYFNELPMVLVLLTFTFTKWRRKTVILNTDFPIFLHIFICFFFLSVLCFML